MSEVENTQEVTLDTGELKPIHPLLYEVLEGIFSGQLAHNQKTYHCETSHCVAGWIEIKWLENANIPFSYGLYDSYKNYLTRYSYFKSIGIQNEGTWHIAQELMGLTDIESTLLFGCDVSILLQKQVYAYLKAGNRILDNSTCNEYRVDGYFVEDKYFREFLQANNYPIQDYTEDMDYA